MNGIKKLFGFELRKLCYGKTALVFVGVILALIFTITPVYYFVFSENYDDPPLRTEEEMLKYRESELKFYQSSLTEYETILSAYEHDMSREDKDFYLDKIAQLRFYIETGTIESDYMNANYLSKKYKTRENSGFMFLIGQITSFLLWALAIGGAAYLFTSEYHSQSIKNVFAARLSRNKIFYVKLLLLLVFVTSLFLILFLIGLFFGLSESSRLAVMLNGNYVAISAVTAYAAQSTSTFVLALLFMSATVLGGIAFKNLAIGIVSPTVPYAIALISEFLLTDRNNPNPILQQINFVDKIPFLSLQFHVGTFDNAFIIALLIHFAVAVLFLVCGGLIFRKQDL